MGHATIMKDRLKITIYCPDENFRLSANLVHDQGVGGGKTAIVSLAHALARLGHNVRVVGHVEEGVSGGVEYSRWTGSTALKPISFS